MAIKNIIDILVVSLILIIFFGYCIFYIEKPSVELFCLYDHAFNFRLYEERDAQIISINYPYGLSIYIISISIITIILFFKIKLFKNIFMYSSFFIIVLYYLVINYLNPAMPHCDDHRYPIPDVPVLYILILLLIVYGLVSTIFEKFNLRSVS